MQRRSFDNQWKPTQKEVMNPNKKVKKNKDYSFKLFHKKCAFALK